MYSASNLTKLTTPIPVEIDWIAKVTTFHKLFAHLWALASGEWRVLKVILEDRYRRTALGCEASINHQFRACHK